MEDRKFQLFCFKTSATRTQENMNSFSTYRMLLAMRYCPLFFYSAWSTTWNERFHSESFLDTNRQLWDYTPLYCSTWTLSNRPQMWVTLCEKTYSSIWRICSLPPSYPVTLSFTLFGLTKKLTSFYSSSHSAYAPRNGFLCLETSKISVSPGDSALAFVWGQ